MSKTRTTMTADQIEMEVQEWLQGEKASDDQIVSIHELLFDSKITKREDGTYEVVA